MTEDIEDQLAALDQLNLEQLRIELRQHSRTHRPTLRSPDFLRGLLAWRLQEKAFGGLSADTKRRLKRLGQAFENNPDFSPTPNSRLKPGTILAREWRGVVHRVRVLDKGFEYEGERFESLSEIARRITGTRWSGPLFFGLKRPQTR